MEHKTEQAVSRQLSKDNDINGGERQTTRLNDEEREPTQNMSMPSFTERKECSWREPILVKTNMDITNSMVNNTPSSRVSHLLSKHLSYWYLTVNWRNLFYIYLLTETFNLDGTTFWEVWPCEWHFEEATSSAEHFRIAQDGITGHKVWTESVNGEPERTRYRYRSSPSAKVEGQCECVNCLSSFCYCFLICCSGMFLTP